MPFEAHSDEARRDTLQHGKRTIDLGVIGMNGKCTENTNDESRQRPYDRSTDEAAQYDKDMTEAHDSAGSLEIPQGAAETQDAEDCGEDE